MSRLPRRMVRPPAQEREAAVPDRKMRHGDLDIVADASACEMGR